jgi:hypothetical protein
MATFAELLSQYGQSAISFAQYLAEKIDVRVFGAKGDGITDDTKAVQAAVDAANGSGIKEIWLENGKTYKITSLTDVDDITFIGNGVTITGGASIAVTSIGELSAGFNSHLAESAINVNTLGADVDYLSLLNTKVAEAKDKSRPLRLNQGVYGISDYWVIPPDITVIFDNAEIKLLSASSVGAVISNVWNGGGTTTLFTENVILINPKVNANSIPGENGIGFANAKNINIYNPQIENCIFDDIKKGGRAFQFEGGASVKDCNVYNPVIRNCSIGCNAQGTATAPVINVNFYNVTMENVDTPFNFDSTETAEGALSHEAMSILVDGFSLRNCGKSQVHMALHWTVA